MSAFRAKARSIADLSKQKIFLAIPRSSAESPARIRLQNLFKFGCQQEENREKGGANPCPSLQNVSALTDAVGRTIFLPFSKDLP
jgi:hypothetical protein